MDEHTNHGDADITRSNGPRERALAREVQKAHKRRVKAEARERRERAHATVLPAGLLTSPRGGSPHNAAGSTHKPKGRTASDRNF